MANHGFVKCKKKVTFEALGKALVEINQDRFDNYLDISEGHESWIVTCPNYWGRGDMPIWLKTSRTIETRHQHGGDLWWWVDSVITNELALKFNGRIADEGVSDTWDAKEEYYPTYQSWCEMMINHIEDPEHRAICFKNHNLGVPKQFQFAF